jgi:15,16-dihydrobiliverdin:ferredoxin oxidoreductase
MSEASSAHGMPWSTTIGRTDETNPLLYMPFWEWQLDFMKESLTNLHPIECRTLNDLEVSYNDNQEKRARIVNHCYASDEYRKIRMTYYDAGDSVQVFNSVWYPDAKYNLPVLGIDLLSFNRKRYLAIVDFQPLHQDEDDHATTYEHILHPIKDKYDTLKGKMSSKFYDETQFFSKEMLFARFEDGKIVDKDLFPAFQSYVKTHLELVQNTPAATSSEEVQHVFDRQKAYDTYSADRDPAAGLFAAMFGKQWAEDFIYDFLFSLSERSEEGLNLSPPSFGGPPPGGRPGGGAPSGGAPVQKEAPRKVSA